MALVRCTECGKEVSDRAAACPHCGKPTPPQTAGRDPNTQSKETWGKFGCFGCLILVAAFVVLMIWVASSDVSNSARERAKSAYKSARDSAAKSAAKSPSPFEQAMAQVKLDYTWGTGASDLVMIANFTITNPTPHRIKDVEITCTHYAPSGTRIDSNKRTIYEVVPAKGRKRIPKFNMGFIHSQAKSTACEITNLVVG